MSSKVQEGREMQENYVEDEAVLTSYMHDMRAAREDADRELAHMRSMAENAHKDWMRKLKDRRKEVNYATATHSANVSKQNFQLSMLSFTNTVALLDMAGHVQQLRLSQLFAP